MGAAIVQDAEVGASDIADLGGDSESPRATEADLLLRLEEAFELRHDLEGRGYRIATEILALTADGACPHAAAVAEVVAAYAEAADEAPETIVERLERASGVLERVDDPVNLLRASDMLSTIKEGSGDYPEALRYAERSLSLSRRVGDRLFEGYALSSLMGVFTATGEYEAALEKGKMALGIAEEIGSSRLESRLCLRVGSAYRQAGDYPQAREMLQRAFAVARAGGNPLTEAAAKVELAYIAEAEGPVEEAEAFLEEAQSASQGDGWLIMGPRILLGFCRVYLRLGRYEAVEAAYVKLELVAQGFHLTPVVAEAAALRAEALEKRGLAIEALAALRHHIALREKVVEREAQQAVKRFQVKVAVAAAEKDAEIHRLRYVELEAMQTQLLESERMAAVGGLAAGLAHEMNTPLGVLKSNLDTSERAVARLKEVLGADAATRVQGLLRALGSAHGTSRTAAERLETWVASLRRFTRLDEAEKQTFDIVEGLAATLELARPGTPEGLELKAEFAPVPLLDGWPGRLNQAFLTLVMNAVEALDGKGQVIVRTRADGDTAVVTIEDNGPGIPKDVQPRLFDLSFESAGPRTRFRVGLATVRSIVHRHRGDIEFVSHAETGTKFTLRFPIER